MECFPHSLSYPFYSLFICSVESVFTSKYISIDFKMRGNKKLLIYVGLFIILVHLLETVKCKSACQNSYVFLSIPACWKHNSFTLASNKKIGSQKAVSLLFFPNCIVLYIWNRQLRYFIHLLSPKKLNCFVMPFNSGNWWSSKNC